MTENQKAIYTELQTKKQELDQLLQANNITIKTLTAEQQATLASLETIMKMEDAPQDIGKGAFLKVAGNILKKLQAAADPFKILSGDVIKLI